MLKKISQIPKISFHILSYPSISFHILSNPKHIQGGELPDGSCYAAAAAAAAAAVAAADAPAPEASMQSTLHHAGSYNVTLLSLESATKLMVRLLALILCKTS
jgi:hypothetical protein